MLSRFTEEQAEVRLIIAGQETGDYGIGSRHLYECLRRLAVIQPAPADSLNSSEPKAFRERILNETDQSFRILVSPDPRVETLSDRPQQLKIIGF
jgi:hypothetical protein